METKNNEVGIFKNEDGTYTLRWEEYSNGKDYYSWGGEETGELKSVTFKPEELAYIDLSRNNIHFGVTTIVYNISPSWLLTIANKLKAIVPDLVELDPDWDGSHYYYVNMGNIGIYVKGKGRIPKEDGEIDSSVVMFNNGESLFLYGTQVETFDRVYNKYIKNNKNKE